MADAVGHAGPVRREASGHRIGLEVVAEDEVAGVGFDDVGRPRRELCHERICARNEGVRVAGRVQLGSVTKKMTPSGEELNFRICDFKGDGTPGDSVPVRA